MAAKGSQDTEKPRIPADRASLFASLPTGRTANDARFAADQAALLSRLAVRGVQIPQQ